MVMIDIAKWLVPILCRAPGRSFQHFSPHLVQTKLELATNYLAVLEITEPGLSKESVQKRKPITRVMALLLKRWAFPKKTTHYEASVCTL